MKPASLALAFAAIGFCGLVQAQSPSATFTLARQPALSDGATPPPGQTAVGRWTTGSSSASAFTELVSGEDTSDIRRSEPVADFWNGGFGNATASTRDTATGDRVVASAQVLPTQLIASVDFPHPAPSDRGRAYASWDRSFELAPHSSVTFSGIGIYEKDGVSTPAFGQVDAFERTCAPYRTPGSTWMGGCSANMLSFHEFSEGNWGTLYLTGGFHNFEPEQLADLDFQTLATARMTGFSYSSGSNGELLMTLTNHLDIVSTGYFEVNIGMSGVAPVPEPQAYLCMLLGLAALGGVARWRGRT